MSTEHIKTEQTELETTGEIPADLLKDLLPRKASLAGRVWMGGLLVIIALGLIAYIHQLRKGLIITDMRDFTSWAAQSRSYQPVWRPLRATAPPLPR